MTNIKDILKITSYPINQDFVIALTKNTYESIDNETKENCKIIKFSQEWNFDDVLLGILQLNPNEYPNLFIFIIDTIKSDDFAFVTILKRFLINFGANRSLILQLTSKNEKKNKFYYKEQSSDDFQDVEEQQVIDSGDFNNFSSFLWTYLNNTVDLQSLKDKCLKDIQNSSLILKFIRTLKLSEEIEDDLVLKCAAEGSLLDFLASANGFIDDKGEICGNELKYYLCNEFKSLSVLLKAIEHSNQPIIEFLIQKCSTFIQQLPFEHQIAISTLIFNANKIEVLCDLLELSDYPFPDNKELKSTDNPRLQRIIDERIEFHEHIQTENIKEIKKFEEKNPKLKFAYNLDNKSALGNALDSKKYQAFYWLKSLRYCDHQIENIEDGSLSGEDKENAKTFAIKQRRENVETLKANPLTAVQVLATRSHIYNRNKSKESENEQHKKIREWLDDIYKTRYGSKLLDAAAQCEELKIIFDFECDSTSNVDSSGSSQVEGSTYPVSKWIFIGAQYTGGMEREQRIKGVIAHEICHYVMQLVYQNNDHPYYENDKYAKKLFDEVVAVVHSILADLKKKQTENENNNEEDNQEVYDKCDGIISTVYDLYDEVNWHPELIVRPVQIQVQFDDDKEKLGQLGELYVRLFAYFDLLVMRELEKFNLKQRKMAKKFNNHAGLLTKIQESNLKFLIPKGLKETLKNQITVVTTNAPKLFLSNLHDRLKDKSKQMFEFQNIFTSSKILANRFAFEIFENILNQNQDLNIIVDYSKVFEKVIDLIGSKHKFIFVVSNENQQEELSKKLQTKEIVTMLTINYDWMDLTTESKIKLLQTKVNFQNNSTFSLLDLIQNNTEHQDLDTCFDNIVDNKLLNLLTEKSGIVINQHFEEDLSDKCVRIMFQSRDFIKTSENEETEKMDQDQMLNHSKNLKVILIADKAGSGKSWILKTFTNKLREEIPQKWITYVDLKQYIKEFKPQKSKIEFASFMTEKILKLKTNFESETFKQLYKNGKVCILFDGFDEIAPDCAECVTQLFQSFHQNDGNQIWIATRDFFEVDLKEKLGLDAAYKLHKFTDENGANIIASNWLFDELHSKGENYNEIFGAKYSEKLKSYKILAKKLNQKIPKSQDDSIGLPQFYKMIADISSKNKDLAINFTNLKIFEECADIQYERWAKEKGELRSKANVRSQHMDLNFHNLHQLIAMESLFPDETEFCGLCLEEIKKWPEEEIIACAMIIKKFGKFLFSHETLREFYAARFILEMLKKLQHHENACKYLLQFLTVKKYEVIRMFLNDAFADEKFTKEITPNLKRFATIIGNNIQEFENSLEIFEEKFQHLAEFVIGIFSYSSKERVKKILLKNKKITLMAANYSNLFTQIQRMIFDYFDGNELKNFLLENGTFLSIIFSIPDEQTAENFITGVKERTKNNPKFISQAFQIEERQEKNVKSINISAGQFTLIFNIIENISTVNEIISCINEVVKNALFFQNLEIMQFIWLELEITISSADFKCYMLDNQYDQKEKQTILMIAAKCDRIEFHETLWNVLLNTFENRDELKDLIMQENQYGNNFVHYLVIYNKPEIIDSTITKVKENFSKYQYEEILKSKGQVGRNLFQLAAYSSKDIKTHQTLWKNFRDFCKSNKEFLEFLKNVDNQNNNVLHIAASFTSKEIFEFMINEIEKIASNEELKNIFETLGQVNKNFLQSAARQNESVELHEYLWTTIKKYFNSQEILDMIKHANDYEYNLLMCAVECNTKEVLELTWTKIKNIFDTMENISKIQDYLSTVNNKQENILHILINSNDSEKLQFLWTELLKYFTTHHFKELLSQKTANASNVLHYAAKGDKIEFHKTLWELLLNTFVNREELKNWIMQGNQFGNNFVHFFVIYNKPEIIDFTIEKIKEKFSKDQYEEILKPKRQVGKNLLQLAACNSKDIKTHQILWRIFQDFFKSDEEFLEFLKYVDNQNSNVLHIAAALTSKEIFEFMINEIEKVASNEELKNILRTLGLANKNLLQSAARQNKSVELHEYLWTTIKKYFNSQEILDMIKHANDYEYNLLMFAVACNTKEVLELTWTKIKNIFDTKENISKIQDYLSTVNNKQENILHILINSNNSEKLQFLWTELLKYFTTQHFKELLSQKTANASNVLHYAAKGDKIEFHKTLWELLLNTFVNREELKNWIMQGNQFGNNFVHFFVIYNKPEIIDFTIEKIKEKFSKDQYEEILKPKRQVGKNLLQLAACNSKDIKTHQILWRIFQDFCKSDEEFLEFLKYVDNQNSNVLHIAAALTSKEIFEFMINEIEKVASNEELKNILRTLGLANKNLLQSAARQNKSVELHEYLWTTIKKYFNSQEILDMIKHANDYEYNLLLFAVACNTKEVLELTWTKIKNIFDTKENISKIQDYLSTVNNKQENILHILINSNNSEKLQFLWTELLKYFTNQQFRELLSQKTVNASNVLHYAAKYVKIEFHETLWELLLNTFEDRVELKDLILQGDKDGNNFIHRLVIYNKPEIIDFAIEKIKENFSKDQYEEILKSKGQFGRNLFQLAACNSKDIKTHQILWKIFRDFCKSNKEFLEFLKNVDNQNNNVLHIAASFTSKEIFEFMINEIEKIASNEELKNIFKTLGQVNKNFLQSAARQNESVELHEYLWTTIKKYFNSQEILDMIKHANDYEYNLLMCAVECNTKEVLELTWTKIKNIFDTMENISKIQDYLSTVNNKQENILHILINSNDSEKLQFLWTELLKYFTTQHFKELLSQKTEDGENVLHNAAKCDKIEFHETLWELLLNTFKNRVELKDLIVQENQYGNNFAHFLLIYNKPEIIDFIINNVKENFSNNQYKEILKSKGLVGLNLLQLAACSSKVIKTHQILWRIFRDFCKCDEDFFEFLKEVDHAGSDILILAACFTSTEIFEFMINEIKKIASNKKIKIILKTLGMVNRNLLQSAARQNKSVELHEYLWTTIKKYFNSQEILDMIKHADKYGDNFLMCVVECNTKEVLEMTWTEIKNIFDKTENITKIQDYLSSVNKEQENILHILINSNNSEKLQFLWTELLKYFTNQQFRELLSQKTVNASNVLHYAAKYVKIEFHETLWELLLNTFEDRVELKDLILQGDKDGNNFIHRLVIYNKPEIIDFAIEKIKENFSKDQYEEILKSKGQVGRNLLQKAACNSKDIKTHQILWRIFRDFCKSDKEFLEFLKNVDHAGSNILILAASFTSKEIFEFMINEIEKVASNEELKNILRTLGLANKNLLQSAARQNKSVELHEYLWTTIKKYFNSQEILDMIKHANDYEYNLLMCAVECNTKEVLELTWTEIKNIFDKTENITKMQDYLSSVNKEQENILHILINSNDSEKLQFLWTELLKYFTTQHFKELLSQKIANASNVLHDAAKGDKIEFHKTLWELLLNTFENREELKDLIMQGNQNGNNFIHLLVIYNKPEIIDFAIEKIKENFSKDQYEEILKSKGQVGRNLLQKAACNSKDIKTHQILWRIFRDFCKSDKEFLEFLKNVDHAGSNILILAASFTSKEIFEFMIDEIEKIAPNKELKNILKTLGNANKNLLQSAALQNESVELHEYLWTTIKKYFNLLEILDLLKHADENGDNLLMYAVEYNTKKFLELTWTEIKNIFDKTGKTTKIQEYLRSVNKKRENILHILINSNDSEKQQFLWTELLKYFTTQHFKELLSQKTANASNVLHYAAKGDKIEFHKTLWELLLNTFKNREKLKDLIMQGNQNGNNFIHLLVIYNKPEIIDFTIEKIKENLSDNQYEKILKSRGEFGRNLLQTAACGSKDIKTHQILWRIFRDFCKSDEEFLEFLKNIDNQSNNVIHLAASFTSKEIFEFMINEIDKIAPNKELKNILRTFGNANKNLLQSAALQNESVELHEYLWTTIKKYLNSQEILDMIKHANEFRDNLLMNAVECNTKEVLELIRTEIKNIFDKTENITKIQDYLSSVNKEQENILHILINSNDSEKQQFLWTELLKYFTTQHFKELLSQKTANASNVLHYAAKGDKIEFHKTLWELLLNTFKNREKLKDLIMQGNQNGNSFIHLLVIYNKPEIIDFTIEKIKENLSDNQYEKILKSRGEFGRNLLQTAACYLKDIKTHQILWRIFRDFCKSDEEFLKFLKNVDKDDGNVFHVAAAFTSKEIFEFLIKEIEKIASNGELKNILRTLGVASRNLLQSAALQNKSVELHKYLWTTIKKYFNSQEILDFINHCDEDSNHLIHSVVVCNTIEIVKLTWENIKEFIKLKENQIIYLKKKGFNNQNLLQRVLFNKEHCEEVESWVKGLADEYEILFEQNKTNVYTKIKAYIGGNAN